MEKGILEVRVGIKTEELEDSTSNKIDEIQLVVPLKDGSEVFSDWMKVTATSLDSITLVRKPKDKPDSWEPLELTKTLEETEALEAKGDAKDPRVVDITYDQTLDLKEVVNTMLKKGDWADFSGSLPTYGLSYDFDLNDEEGETIVYELGSNNTDQQQFINLSGSVVSTRVYDIEGANPASIDRTPIVHVMLKNGDCVVLDGFIKLNIVESEPQTVDPVTIPVSGGTIIAGCGEFADTVKTKQMNEEFYAKAQVTKTFFHANYVWSEVTDEDGNPVGVGTIVELQDPNDTESYNLVWTVTEDELWENLGKEITKSGKYVYGDNVIEVTFTGKVEQPSIELGGLMLENYWDADFTYIKHNVAVPDKGATDPALCTYENNINNAFKTDDEKLLDLTYISDKYADYEYEYIFDKVEKQPLFDKVFYKDTKQKVVFEVSADGKELIASVPGEGIDKETVATINDQEPGTGDPLQYGEGDLAKYLLNKDSEFMKARILLQVTNTCGREVIVKGFGKEGGFNVHFLRPVNVKGEAADNFVDGVDYGAEGSVLDLKDVVKLEDWRNYASANDINTYDFDPDNENYYDYYDVQKLTVDTENIVPVGLVVGGKDLTELPSTIEVTQVPELLPDYPAADHPYGVLTYKNNGANLITEFTMKVPVVVEYKWGKVETIVEVKVLPTSAVKSARK